MNRSRVHALLLAATISTGCTVQPLTDDDADADESGDGTDHDGATDESDGNAEDGGEGAETFGEAALRAGRLPAVPDDGIRELEPFEGEPTEDRCGAVSYWERTRAFDRVAVQQNHGSELFPGNVIDGADALGGRLTRLKGTLAPVTYSLSIHNAGRVSAELDAPSLDTFRTSWNDLLAEAEGATSAADLKFHLASVTTEEQLSTALEGSVGFLDLFKLGAGLQFSSTQVQSRFVVAFDQTYYTIDAEPKDSADAFFASGAEPVDAPPLYIRSIRYGRRVVLAVASTLSQLETQEMLSAGLTDAGSGLSFGASFTEEQRLAFSSLEIQAHVTGGELASVPLEVAGIESVAGLLGIAAEFDARNPGAPIDFQLAHVVDNSIARLYEVSQYRQHSCVDLLVGLELLDAAPDLGDPGEFYGPLHLYVTEDASEPCGVERTLLLGNMGTDWAGAFMSEVAIQVPSGPDRPVCVWGSLKEADLSSDDDYGPVDMTFTLPVAPMTQVEQEQELTDGTDILSVAAELTVLGTSSASLE